MQLTKPRRARSFAGFSMLEVLITILVLSIGFLGLAKMQAAALSNTQTARVRSLVALQAASLVAAMHGNSAYWADAPAGFTATGTTVTSTEAEIASPTQACITAVCTKQQLAGADVKQWVLGLNSKFPSYSATVTCTAKSAAPPSPATCKINITWLENVVAVNRTTATGATTNQPSFQLFVEP